MLEAKTPPERITVYLTDSAPISIVESAWPKVARVRVYNDKSPAAATEQAWVCVRKEHNHEAVMLVHGIRTAPGKEARAGYIVKDEAALADAIHKVCAVVGIEPQTVFDKLPVREW